jgi:DNA (cytosine-5)-methyltransferase 3A
MSTEQGEEITTLERYLELKSEGFAFSGQSYLFWEFVRILRETNPRYFLLENVCMAKKWERVISDVLNVEPILIDSRLVSAQMRRRLYWTNIPGVTQPKDRGIKLHTILDGVDAPQLNKGAIVGRRLNAFGKREDYNKGIPVMQCLEVRDINRDKSNCLTTVAKDTVLTPLPVGRYPNVFKTKEPFRYYALSECCRLQTVPENYFQGVSEHQAKKLLGNGWTVEVIAHILSHIPQEER